MCRWTFLAVTIVLSTMSLAPIAFGCAVIASGLVDPLQRPCTPGDRDGALSAVVPAWIGFCAT
jgi:hypothetical protein